MGWARAWLWYEGKHENIDIGSLQESLAISVQRRLNLVEYQKTFCTVLAAMGSDKIGEAIKDLLGSMFPEAAEEREKAMTRAMEILKEETSKTYKVARKGKPTGLIKKRRK